MKELYKKIDNSFLKNNPFQWIIGWHKFLPLFFILAIIAVCVGFLIPTKIYTYSPPFLEPLSFFIGFLTLLVFVLFVVRQIRFNSYRIHYKIPYKKSITTYFSFILFILLLAIIPFIPMEVYNYRVQNKVDSITTDLKEDIETLNSSTFFFIDNNNKTYRYVKNNKSPAIDKLNIVFTDSSVTINKLNYPFTYYYHNNDLPITITKNEALKKISNFLKVAKKYDIDIAESNPNVIFNKRKAYNRNKEKYSYNLLVLKNKQQVYNIKNAYSNMLRNYQKYEGDYIMHDKYILFGFLFFATILALLLWIFISVPFADFGFAVLAGILIAIFVGILAVIIGSETYIRFLLYLVIIAIFLIAFMSKENSLLTRIMKILSQLLIPVFVALLFWEYFDKYSYKLNYENHDELYYFIRDAFPIVILLTIVSTVFLYKYIYRNSRMLPK